MRAFAVLVLALALGCGAAEAKAGAWLELKPCPIPGSKAVAECGHLIVPENWTKPDGRKISLNIVVLPKTGSGPEQAPLFDLQGGPGVPATNDALLFATDLKIHRVRRAVVMIDQRGTGKSNALHCPSMENASPLEDIDVPARVAACARALSLKADLRQYTTEASARDLDAVREALGYAQVDLMGLSYGTMLAQAYMKLYPKSVHAAAFMGTVPLGEKLPLHHAINADHTLQGIFHDCHDDGICHKAFPELEHDWRLFLRRLEVQPVVGFATNRVALHKGPLLEALRGTLALVFAQRQLPAAIHAAAHGDLGPILKMLPKTESSLIPLGMDLSVTCPHALQILPSEIVRETEGTSFGAYRVDQQIAACRLWPAAKPSKLLQGPLVSDIPVLIIAGGRDAVTPLDWANRVSSTLPHSRIVEIASLTHLPVGLTNMICMDQIMDAFFARGSAVGLDTSCVETMKAPSFMVATPPHLSQGRS